MATTMCLNSTLHPLFVRLQPGGTGELRALQSSKTWELSNYGMAKKQSASIGIDNTNDHCTFVSKPIPYPSLQY